MSRLPKTALLSAFLSAVVLLFVPVDTRAQTWTNLGLYGGHIYDIAIDPSNPDQMFAGSYMGDGLFFSADGGKQWQAVRTEDLHDGEDAFKNQAVWVVKIASGNPDIVWAAHNYWVEMSTDRGRSWNHIFNSAMQRDCANCGGADDNFRFCRSLAIDPSNPDRVYVGTGGPFGTYPSGAVYMTDDGGQTWTKLNQGVDFDSTVTDIAIDPQDPDILWIVTSSFGSGGWAGSLYRSEDGGRVWENILTLDSGMVSVAVDPVRSDRAFTGSGYGVVEHYFDGTQWQFRWPVIPESRLVEQVVFDPQNPQIVYATWLRPTGWGGDGVGKVARSADGGNTWLAQDIHPHDYDFVSLAVHPANSQILFAGDRSQGVFKSEDAGRSWTAVNNGVNAVIVYDVVVDPNDSEHLLAGTISGLYERQASGQWLRLVTNQARAVQFHPTDSLTFFAGLWGWLAKTEDGGASWSFTNLNTSRYVRDIGIDPTNRDKLFVAVGSQILRSLDGGMTFENVLQGENRSGEAYEFNAVTIDPSDPHHLFAGGGNFYVPRVKGDLWESIDGGTSWSRTSLVDVVVNALIVDPNDSDVIYAGCGYSGGTDVPVFRSTDGGDTWIPYSGGIPGAANRLTGIWGSSRSNVLAASLFGPFTKTASFYRYDGSSWHEEESGVSEDFYDVWGASAADVYAVGTSGTIIRYDGSRWTSMAAAGTDTLNGVWGSSGTDIYAVGVNGSIQHFDGSRWASAAGVTTQNLEGVWGSSASDVFAVGDNGTIVHYDGQRWSAMASGTDADLEDVWGSSAADVFAVGGAGTILHYDGNAWSAMDSRTRRGLNGIWGFSPTRVFAVGDFRTILSYDGVSWTESSLGTSESFQDVWGASDTDVFVIGDLGAIFHYDGTTWSSDRPAGSFHNAITDLGFHRDTSDFVYAGTWGAGVYVSPNRGRNWLNLGTPEQRVFAIATSSVYAGTQAGILQCTGTGVLAGRLADHRSRDGIDGAVVFTDFGVKTRSVNGDYMMVSPAGIFSVTAVRDAYANMTVADVTIPGGDVTWMNIDMTEGVSDPSAADESGDGGGSGGGGFG